MASFISGSVLRMRQTAELSGLNGGPLHSWLSHRESQCLFLHLNYVACSQADLVQRSH